MPESEKTRSAFFEFGWLMAKDEARTSSILEWHEGLLFGIAVGLLFAEALSAHWQLGFAVVFLLLHRLHKVWRRSRASSDAAFGLQQGMRALTGGVTFKMRKP